MGKEEAFLSPGSGPEKNSKPGIAAGKEKYEKKC